MNELRLLNKHMSYPFIIIGIFLFSPTLAAPFSLTAELGGVNSAYTETTLRMMQSIISAPPTLPSEFQLHCFEKPDNELYIGVEQSVLINAPFANVEAVLNDIDHYSELFPGYKKTSIVSRDENKLLTFWEQRIPIFFVPNVKYEMVYLLNRPTPNQATYRYQLKNKGTLKASDGFIVIQKKDDLHTEYHEVDFVDAEWGAAKILGKTKIWQDSVEGIYHSDLAVKLKAENEAWTNEQARSAAKKELNHALVDTCLKERKAAAPIPSSVFNPSVASAEASAVSSFSSTSPTPRTSPTAIAATPSATPVTSQK